MFVVVELIRFNPLQGWKHMSMWTMTWWHFVPIEDPPPQVICRNKLKGISCDFCLLCCEGNQPKPLTVRTFIWKISLHYFQCSLFPLNIPWRLSPLTYSNPFSEISLFLSKLFWLSSKFLRCFAGGGTSKLTLNLSLGKTNWQLRYVQYPPKTCSSAYWNSFGFPWNSSDVSSVKRAPDFASNFTFWQKLPTLVIILCGKY